MTVGLDGRDLDLLVPKQIEFGGVPFEPLDHKAAHHGGKAEFEGAFAHGLGVGKVEIDHAAVGVAHGVARGEHEKVVAHVKFVVKILVKDFFIRL